MTPDIVDITPDGAHVFVASRGPIPLTGDPHVSVGVNPGVGVM
jgi:hypothetical protein